MRLYSGIPILSRIAFLALFLGVQLLARAQIGSSPLLTENDARMAALREEFLDAYRKAANGRELSNEHDGAALMSYVIYPYLEAARLEYGLLAAKTADSDVDDAVERFLDDRAPEPLADALRRRWLVSLARREAWPRFVDRYDSRIVNARLECQYLSARVALDATDGLAERVSKRWLTASQLPIECEPAFQWLRETGVLDDELTEQRVKLLLESGQVGFARVIARRLPEARAAPLLRWARLLQNPIAEFDALIAAPQSGVLPEALASAWSRFARANPQAALDRFELLLATQKLSSSDTSKYARDLALGLSWDRLASKAIETFGLVADGDLDDYTLEWLTRAALWTDDWRLADDAIAAMTVERQSSSAWRYWSARAAQKLATDDTASERFADIIATDNYYSAMAAAHLDKGLQPGLATLPQDAKLIDELEARPGFMRARELFAVGLRTEATREWLSASADLSKLEREQSVHLAARWGWYDIGVATASRSGIFNDYELLYPRPYDTEIRRASRLAELPESLIYGLLRQESLYRRDAVSPAGAIGLTQLLPETARRTAELWEQKSPSQTDLYEADVNIRLGAAQLRTLQDQFDNQLVVALAAYNAGPNAARRWLPDRPIDADVWVENIPYNETREFVRRVLWHSLVFSWLENRRDQDTLGWLDSVVPLNSE